MFDPHSRSVVRYLIGLFAFRSNPVSKVYQHRSRDDVILEVTWSRESDLLALVCGVFCEFVTFPLVSWVRCGT